MLREQFFPSFLNASLLIGINILIFFRSLSVVLFIDEIPVAVRPSSVFLNHPAAPTPPSVHGLVSVLGGHPHQTHLLQDNDGITILNLSLFFRIKQAVFVTVPLRLDMF